MSKKPGFLTPKAIANRIKSKGLQKLRWYCQMCQKQCRDENGFKCHTMSESHQRQLLLFAENPDDYLDTFSKEFFEGYTGLLKHRFGTKRINANQVYQEYISDRNHTHMNSTQWETLTDFIKWLGREGHCVVDQTEKGWFVQYIDRDPETIKRQEAFKVKEKMARDDEEQLAKFIELQMERAGGPNRGSAEFTELQRQDKEEKVAFGFGAAKKTEASKPERLITANAFDEEASSSDNKSSKDKGKSKVKSGDKRKSALDEIMQAEEAGKEKRNRKDNWLHEGIVVKVTTKRLGDKYHRKKGVVREVRELYGAVLKMVDSGDVIKLDQTLLETVIPSVGRPVLLVNGAYRGQQASLLALNESKFSCKVEIATGPLKGRVVDDVKYEDLSKLHIASS